MNCPQAELVSGGVTLAPRSVWRSTMRPFPFRHTAWSVEETRTYTGSNKDTFYSTRQRNHMVPCLILIPEQQEEHGPGENNSGLPWMKVLLFSGSTCCPRLAHNRQSWLKLGVTVVKRASCQAFWLQEWQDRHCGYVLAPLQPLRLICKECDIGCEMSEYL